MLRILLTGGGTGGHIYPLVALADELLKIANEKMVDVRLTYVGPRSPLEEEFEKRDIRVFHILSSKLRRYFSPYNILDVPKFFFSIFQALFRLYLIMPDVVFSKGGPGTLAVVLAAKFYAVPILIHESDAVPGLTNRLSGGLAKRIAISFEHAANYFPPAKTALTGNPVRKELLEGLLEPQKAKERVRFEGDKPLMLVLGGSQGSDRINAFVFEHIASLLETTQIYHQVGERWLYEAKRFEEAYPNRYRAVGTFDLQGMREALNAADLVLSRAGAGAIFEISAFGKPSILIPLQESANDHQLVNAYEYEKTGAAIVIEEANFTIHIVLVQIKNILLDRAKAEAMSLAAKQFSRLQAAEIIAQEIVKLVSRGNF